MARSQRQLKILEIISKYEIDRQEELVEKLNEEGFLVTQATVSRDIRDMGIIKTLSSDGKGYRYVSQKISEDDNSERYHKLFKSSVVSIEASENIIVVKTESGTANSAAALIDKLCYEDVLGAVAGDDTIIVVVADKNKTDAVIEKFEALLKN